MKYLALTIAIALTACGDVYYGSTPIVIPCEDGSTTTIDMTTELPCDIYSPDGWVQVNDLAEGENYQYPWYCAYGDLNLTDLESTTPTDYYVQCVDQGVKIIVCYLQFGETSD